MKINAEVEIFDDPEYCNDKEGCFFFQWHNFSRLCCLYMDWLDYGSFDHQFKKCPQCKEAYQKAKEGPEIWYTLVFCQKCNHMDRIFDKTKQSEIVQNDGVYICPKCDKT